MKKALKDLMILFFLILIAVVREKVSDKCKVLDDQLLNSGYFKFMVIQNDLVKVPENQKDQCKWYENLSVSHRLSYFFSFYTLFMIN